MRRLSLTIPLLVLAVAAPLAAGTIVTTERRELPNGTAKPMVITVDANLVAISGGGDDRMIFRGDRQQMLIIDDEKRSYLTIDQAMMTGVAKQIDAATKQMQEAIANLPADQQAMARRLMEQQQQQQPQVGQRVDVARAEAALDTGEQVRNTGETATREGYPCVKYEVHEDGQKIRELWVTDWSNVEGRAELEAAMESMNDFAEQLTASFGNAFGAAGSPVAASGMSSWWHGIDGMPVVTTDFENGVATEVSVVRSIETSSVQGSTFEVPEGYTQKRIGE
jgi:hypothetical protein